MVLTGGVHLLVEREREGREGRGSWAEAGWAAARSWAPGAAQLDVVSSFPFLFFVMFPFSFYF
jgi:hypothetical protein